LRIAADNIYQQQFSTKTTIDIFSTIYILPPV
jgi:hypothetical protein